MNSGCWCWKRFPGWQHIGDTAWQDVAVRNVGEMIRRDWNHPSIILWGVRINESQDNHDFYTRTNQAAHSLDDARQTGGIRYLYNSELLEDVFTMNDFGFPLQAAESSAVSEYRIQRPHVLHQALRQRLAGGRARAAARPRAQPTGRRRPLRRRHRLVRLRLQHPRQFRLRRPHLLSRRQRHLPHSQAGRRRLQIAVRSRRKRW